MERIEAVEHGVVFRCPATDRFGYFGWPTAAKLRDGRILVGVSGFRNGHVCPFGRTVLFESCDDGESWSDPSIVNNSLIDDRDVGVTALSDGGALISHFSTDTRIYFTETAKQNRVDFRAVLDSWRDEEAFALIGSFVRRMRPDGVFEPARKVAVTAPHGPIELADGTLFYLGSRFADADEAGRLHFSMDTIRRGEIVALRSADGGVSWTEVGTVPTPAAAPKITFCEPHAVELASGRIIGHIRAEGGEHFSTWQSVSDDGGATWSAARRLCGGSPPHLLRHSSGVLIGVCGWRLPGFGQRAMFSCDGGESWETDFVLRDDGPSGDLGYPSTVELSDGSLLTVYYQAPEAGAPCAVLSTHWRLPRRFR